MTKFTEEKLEEAIITLLEREGYEHVKGDDIPRRTDEVLIKEDLKTFLNDKYASDGITSGEIETIIRKLENLPSSDLYESNKTFMKILSDGFALKREDRSKKDIYIQLIDYNGLSEFRPPEPGELITVGEEKRPYKPDKNIIKLLISLK